MNNIKMKIHGTQEDSLLVSFSSEDETPDMYPPCAYQISMFGTDLPITEILKKIAQSGYVQVKYRIKRKDPNNQLKIMEFQELIGREIIFSKDDLFTGLSPQIQEQFDSTVEQQNNIFKSNVIGVLRGTRFDTMSNKLIAYNFFAIKFGCLQKISEEELDSEPLKGRIPVVHSKMYLVETQELLCEVYDIFNTSYGVKIKDSKVTEFYTSGDGHINKPNCSYIAYDIQTNQPIEYYKIEGNFENKYDYSTDELLQQNIMCEFKDLPENIKTQLQQFQFKDKIKLYAISPYGTIVECA